MLAGSETPDGDGKRVPDKMRVELVVQSRLAVCPNAKTPRKRRQISPKAALCIILGRDWRVQPKYLSNQAREHDNMDPLVRGTEAIEVLPGKSRQVSRIC